MSEGTQTGLPAAESPEAEGPEGLGVAVREEGAVTRWLEVEVPPARVDAAFQRAYRSLARSARVRGFRPGKAPVSVLRRLYGPAVAEDVERELVSETLPAALEREALAPVSEPAVDAAPPVEGGAFSYRARIEVKPPIELGALEGLPAKRPSAAVSDEDVERELENLRQRHASLVEEPDLTEAARGHFLTIDFVGRVDGEPFEGGRAREHTVELGSDPLLPGFEEQLVGARAGEERIVRVRFPDDHGSASLAGREAEFTVQVTSIRRREVPALDDEFARDLGDFENLEQVRARIRETLAASRERRARLELRRSLIDSLIERVPVEVPANLVRERLQRRLHSASHDLRERGGRADLIDRQLAQWEEEWRPAIEREIREDWLLEAVAAREGLELTDAEVDERLERMAEEQGIDPARFRKAWRDAGAIEALRRRFLTDKAFEFLLAAASVEDVAGD
jgi:trigger factor